MVNIIMPIGKIISFNTNKQGVQEKLSKRMIWYLRAVATPAITVSNIQIKQIQKL